MLSLTKSHSNSDAWSHEMNVKSSSAISIMQRTNVYIYLLSNFKDTENLQTLFSILVSRKEEREIHVN